MNCEVLGHLTAAERAAATGAWRDAFTRYVAAADLCADLQLHRGALRWYRHALELELRAPVPLERMIATCRRARLTSTPWQRYLDALPALADVAPVVNARHAQLVAGDDGATLRHPALAAPLARIRMTGDADFVVTRTITAIPDPMLLIVLHRALWPAPRELESTPPITVTIDGANYQLQANGDWD